MIGKTWIAMMVGAFVLFGGLATVAAGNMNGDILQDQDRLQLKDGSCQDDLLEDAAATDGMNGDCDQTQDMIQDKLQLKDGSCDQCPCDSLAAEDGSYYYHYWSFYYAELQDGETPYMWQSQNMCVPA